jgi:hypothetical protein
VKDYNTLTLSDVVVAKERVLAVARGTKDMVRAIDRGPGPRLGLRLEESRMPTPSRRPERPAPGSCSAENV